MRYVDVDKKRPSPWAWVLGLAVLGLALWGITILLRPPPPDEQPVVGPTTADSFPPSRIPGNPGQVVPLDRQADTPDLRSLGEEHIGQAVTVEGEVVATGNGGFWVVSDDQVLRIDSSLRTRQGDTVAVRGTLRAADAAATDRMANEVLARHPDFRRWTVIRPLKLVEEEDDPEADPAPATDSDLEAAGNTTGTSG